MPADAPSLAKRIAWVRDLRGYSGAEKATLYAIASRGLVYARQSTIAADSGNAVRAVRNHLAKARADGIAIEDRRPGKTSVWTLTYAETPAPDADVPRQEMPAPRHEVPTTPAPDAEHPGTTCRTSKDFLKDLEKSSSNGGGVLSSLEDVRKWMAKHDDDPRLRKFFEWVGNSNTFNRGQVTGEWLDDKWATWKERNPVGESAASSPSSDEPRYPDSCPECGQFHGHHYTCSHYEEP